MAKVLLDTDILSEYLKGYDAKVTSNAAHYAEDHAVFTFTSVTVYEITYGLRVKAAFSQARRAIAWFRQNEEITPTDEDFLEAASIRAAAKRTGLALELPDCLIAAVAIRLDMALITGNTQDFRAIQGTGVNLRIANWRTL